MGAPWISTSGGGGIELRSGFARSSVLSRVSGAGFTSASLPLESTPLSVFASRIRVGSNEKTLSPDRTMRASQSLLAEGVGFEPTRAFARRFSRPVH